MNTDRVAQARPRVQLCYTDTGGTFTDCMLVDEEGHFTMGKAPTTPEDLSIGYFNAVGNAAHALGLELSVLFRELSVAGYGTTIGTNTLITRTGARVGVLITKGFEQLFLISRGVQTWTGYHMADIIQARTHRHAAPIVALELTKGVTERMDCFGQEVAPLYEEEVASSTRYLLEKGVEAIAVCFLFSWMNPAHELRAGEIVRQIVKENGRNVPVFLRNDICPRVRELGSANATVVEAYIGSKVRKGLNTISDKVREYGFGGNLEVMLSSGGLASAQELNAVDTLESGPAGAPVGALYVGQMYGIENVIGTDVGGTSFDVAIVTRGSISINREPVCARLVLGVPMLEVDSIGAGGGTLARIDPLTGRLAVGPQSAGAVPGPVCYDRGGEIPTVTDADLVLGYLDPNYFLGGRIKLNKEKAVRAIQEKVAGPLGLDLHRAATGIKELIDLKMKDKVLGMAMSRGLDIGEYCVMGFGGAGPSHVSGYTSGLKCKSVATFPYAAAFCAFGAAAADYQRRYYRSSNMRMAAGGSDDEKLQAGQKLNELWQELEEKALASMARQGFSQERVLLTRQAMVRYGGQLDDLIVPSPTPRIGTVRDWDNLIALFEDMYERIYARAAKYGRGGYEILEVGLVASVPKIKPKVPKYRLSGEKAPPGARKGARPCYFDRWVSTAVYDWSKLQAGNVVAGPAIAEHETSTLVIPPGKTAHIDEYLTVWLR